MKKKVKIIICIVFIVTICSILAVLLDNKKEDPNANHQQILNTAMKIEIKEKAISLGKHYNIYVDDLKVAEVTGECLNVFGDTFTMKDANGNFIIKEKEIKRWLSFNRMAEVMDKDNNTLGYIGENTFDKLVGVGYTFNFFDMDHKEKGIAKEKFLSLLHKDVFYDNNGNADYIVKEKFLSLTDDYILTVRDKCNIPLYHAILMVCIEDTIRDTDKK